MTTAPTSRPTNPNPYPSVARDPVAPYRDEPKVFVQVRAQEAKEIKPGVWEFLVPARRLTEAESEQLKDLFPHLSEQVHELLAKEALLAAMKL